MEQLEYYLSAFGFKVGELSRHPLPDGLFTQSNSRYGWLIPEITAHEDDVTRLARKNIYKEFFSITEEPPLVSPVMSYENFVKSGKRHPDIILPKNPVYVDINTMGDDEKFSAIKAFVAVMGNDPQFKKLATPALEKITDGKTQDSIIQSFVRAVTNDPRFENQASPALKKALQTITAEYVAKLGNP
jgi:hypothetical protein